MWVLWIEALRAVVEVVERRLRIRRKIGGGVRSVVFFPLRDAPEDA